MTGLWILFSCFILMISISFISYYRSEKRDQKRYQEWLNSFKNDSSSDNNNV